MKVPAAIPCVIRVRTRNPCAKIPRIPGGLRPWLTYPTNGLSKEKTVRSCASSLPAHLHERPSRARKISEARTTLERPGRRHGILRHLRGKDAGGGSVANRTPVLHPLRVWRLPQPAFEGPAPGRLTVEEAGAPTPQETNSSSRTRGETFAGRQPYVSSGPRTPIGLREKRARCGSPG